MTLKELRDMLDKIPTDKDNEKVVFGQVAYGQPVRNVKVFGNKITIG